jgi:cytochrome c553
MSGAFLRSLTATSPPVLRVCSSSPRRGLALFISIALLASAADAVAAGDWRTGRGKAMLCQACHGTDGISKVPDAPNIAGQTEPYLTTQLQAFKSGARKSETMSLVAKELSDKDIDDLAAYFSAVEIKVIKVPGE